MVHSHASPGQRHLTKCGVTRGLQNAGLVDFAADAAVIAIPRQTA